MENIINIKGLNTEKSSSYHHIEDMTVAEITNHINEEDQIVPFAVKAALNQINALIEQTVMVVKNSGRIFYIGAGTSGRLGIVDASECPPTFGTDPNMVVGIIAGGHGAMFQSVEGAEDDPIQGFLDLQSYNVSIDDIVIGISASGQAPYVVNALRQCQENGIKTGCICSNYNSKMSQYSDYPIEIGGLGPEFITGSSRMKSGTAQKLVLNMISTVTCALNGGVVGSEMANMALSNSKLVERGIHMVMNAQQVSYDEAVVIIKNNGGKMKGLLIKK